MESPQILPFPHDDDLIEAVKSDNVIRLRISVPDEISVVLGRGSKPEIELNVENCLSEKIPVYKRRGGGCAVVLDHDNVIVSVVLPAPGFGENPRYFNLISKWLIAGLNEVGISGVQRRGISDLAIEDKKIGGSCIYRSKGILYFSTTILVDPDISLMELYLKHPPREPEYRAGRSHSQFIMPLRKAYPDLTATDLHRNLSSVLRRDELNATITEVTAE